LYKENDILSKIRAHVSGQRVLWVLKTGIIFQTGHENDKIIRAFPIIRFHEIERFQVMVMAKISPPFKKEGIFSELK